jgi:opacity protein-like surface antigen
VGQPQLFQQCHPSDRGRSGLQRRIGWTVGVGGEYAFTNYLSAFVEYDYYGFGTRDITFNDGTIVGIQDRKSVVKAGLNFRWAPGGAPVRLPRDTE